jgi:putative colanic acid biosynthesis acetyltransferase WcaB
MFKFNFFKFIFQDWNINKDNPKGRIFLLLFRLANICSKSKVYFFIGIPYIILYKILVQWIFTLEVPWNISVGKNFSIYHGQSLVINKTVIIGENCTLRQCTTLGVVSYADGSNSNGPKLGNNVDVGSNVCIIGNLSIGDNVKIGCGSIVINDVQSNCMIAGNPAVVKKTQLP